MGSITFSVVTPSYNQGKFIEETIKSVLSQKGDFCIEYFIMDGGSDDNSVEIIEKYDRLLKEGKWPVECCGIKYHWVSEKDKGQTDAINRGLVMATGDIVSWINSDDLYFPDAFSKVQEYFLNHPEADFLYGDGDVVDKDGNVQWEWLSRPYDLKVLKSYHFLWHDFTNYIMQQATFWRRSVHERIGLLDDSFHYAMDIEYWIRAGAKGLKLAHIPSKLGKFRLIKGTKSLSSPTVFWEDQLEIFRRYNRLNKMRYYFSEYFFREATQDGLDINLAYKKRNVIFRRWKSLPEKEHGILQKEAEKGFDWACLMIANYAFLQGSFQKASLIYQNVINKKPLLLLHPLSIIFLLKRVMGRNISLQLNKGCISIIKCYRRIRYQYRYKKINSQDTEFRVLHS